MATAETVRAYPVHLLQEGERWIVGHAKFDSVQGAIEFFACLHADWGFHVTFDVESEQFAKFPNGVAFTCLTENGTEQWQCSFREKNRYYNEIANRASVAFERAVETLRALRAEVAASPRPEPASSPEAPVLAELHKLFDEGRKLIDEIKGYAEALKLRPDSEPILPVDPANVMAISLRDQNVFIFEATPSDDKLAARKWYIEEYSAPGTVCGPFDSFIEALQAAL